MIALANLTAYCGLGLDNPQLIFFTQDTDVTLRLKIYQEIWNKKKWDWQLQKEI